MSHSHPDLSPPRGLLWAAAAMLGVTLLLSATARWSGVGRTELLAADAVRSSSLWFEDRDDGSIAVLAAPDRRQIEVVEPGTNGFLRGVLRGLARERHRSDIGAVQPFELTRWSDGRLSLADPTTGRTVALEVFGPANSSAFNRLLDAAPDHATVAMTGRPTTRPESLP
jgi:putative photosynthetic complex assembly protein